VLLPREQQFCRVGRAPLSLQLGEEPFFGRSERECRGVAEAFPGGAGGPGVPVLQHRPLQALGCAVVGSVLAPANRVPVVGALRRGLSPAVRSPSWTADRRWRGSRRPRTRTCSRSAGPRPATAAAAGRWHGRGSWAAA